MLKGAELMTNSPVSLIQAVPRTALVVAHPGHELRVFGLAQAHRARVYVLTDGSGRSGISRLSSTARLLKSLGCECGEMFGVASDREIYRAIREHDYAFFLRLVDLLAASFQSRDIELVAGDATEWFNPAHDVCRMLINAASSATQLATGCEIANYAFRLTEWEQGMQEIHDSLCWHVQLEDSALRSKLEAARSYAELRDEVEQAVANRGEEYFRTECLRRVTETHSQGPERPFYETWGERRVAEGEYDSVIRYKEHILPLQQAIDLHVATARPCAKGQVAS
jgi:hypothetical protein